MDCIDSKTSATIALVKSYIPGEIVPTFNTRLAILA